MKKIILLSLLSGAFLFGNPVQNTQSDKKVEQEANLLEYEKILKRLQEKKKAIISKNDTLMKLVLLAMVNMKKDKIETPIGNFTKKISKTTEINESLLPESAFVICKERKSVKELKEMGLTEKEGVIDVEKPTIKFK